MLRGSATRRLVEAALAMRPSWRLPAAHSTVYALPRVISVLPSLRSFSASPALPHPRGAVVSAAAQAAPETDTELAKGDDVAYAVHAACQALGKEVGDEERDLIHKLKSNWFTTALELASMTEAEAKLLGVPLRLTTTVAELLEGRQGTAAAAANSAAPDPAPAPPPAAKAAAPAAAKAAAPAAAGRKAAPKPRPAATAPAAKSSSSSIPQKAMDLIKSTLQLGQAAKPATAATAAAPAKAQAPAAAVAAAADGPSSGSDEDDDGLQEEEDEEGFGLEDGPQEDGDSANSYAVSGAAWDASVPIEQRVCPPLNRFAHRSADWCNVSKRRGRPERYAVRESEMGDALVAEFNDFFRFHTTRFFGQQSEPIAVVTANKYIDHLRGLLGYMHRERGVPLDALSLRSAIPSSKREGVAIAFDYIQWLYRERGISVRTEGLVIRSVMAAAKWLHHGESQMQVASGDKPYSDLEVVRELRKMSNTSKKASKVAARSSDEELKWLSWPEYLALCAELRKECAALDARGQARPPAAVAWSLQRYLVFAILSCIPDRQRTLRELEVGRTLVREHGSGRWVIRHGPGDYKTGKAYGERPPLIIAPHVYPELEAYIDTWRAHLRPGHALLFTQQNGEPTNDKWLYKLHWTSSFRITGKKCNPHLVRDSIVTYLRGGGATERELEALAIYMGHSMAMQRDTYDRRTLGQKVEPAVELLAALNAKALEQQAQPQARV